MKTLENISKKDIVDYRIAEAEFDQDGNVIMDGEFPKSTGRTLEWTIKAGEKAQFPVYVADYLMHIFGQKDPKKPPTTLIEVKGGEFEAGPAQEKVEKTEKPEVPEAKGKDSVALCKECGQSAKNMRGLGLHIAAKHPEVLLK